jgi:hypothetical protein
MRKPSLSKWAIVAGGIEFEWGFGWWLAAASAVLSAGQFMTEMCRMNNCQAEILAAFSGGSRIT